MFGKKGVGVTLEFKKHSVCFMFVEFTRLRIFSRCGGSDCCESNEKQKQRKYIGLEAHGITLLRFYLSPLQNLLIGFCDNILSRYDEPSNSISSNFIPILKQSEI